MQGLPHARPHAQARAPCPLDRPPELLRQGGHAQSEHLAGRTAARRSRQQRSHVGVGGGRQGSGGEQRRVEVEQQLVELGCGAGLGLCIVWVMEKGRQALQQLATVLGVGLRRV